MNNKDTIKVKDLSEPQKQELLKQMQQAGLKGAHLEYKVKTARDALEKYNKDKQNVIETPPKLENIAKQSKKLICHICYGEVIDGICTNCGFKSPKAQVQND